MTESRELSPEERLAVEIAKERQMWKNALAIVLNCPDDLDLIGNPGSENDVREALRPVANLQKAVESML